MGPSEVVIKMRLEKYPNKLVLNLPEGVGELKSLQMDRTPLRQAYDLILAFVFTLEEMNQTFQAVRASEQLAADGALVFIYPKKGNKKYPQFIGRDDIFPYLKVSYETGLVDNTDFKFNQMVAFNDTFTATALKRLGENTRQKGTSQSAGLTANEAVDWIPKLMEALASEPDVLGFYQGLTPGYQKDWARHVYSAKSAATVEKRLKETIDILRQGYKSLNLYRQAQ